MMLKNKTVHAGNFYSYNTGSASEICLYGICCYKLTFSLHVTGWDGTRPVLKTGASGKMHCYEKYESFLQQNSLSGIIPAWDWTEIRIPSLFWPCAGSWKTVFAGDTKDGKCSNGTGTQTTAQTISTTCHDPPTAASYPAVAALPSGAGGKRYNVSCWKIPFWRKFRKNLSPLNKTKSARKSSKPDETYDREVSPFRRLGRLSGRICQHPSVHAAARP